MDFEDFVSVCDINGLKIKNEQGELLKRYVDLLIEWNSKVNLISRKEEDVWGKHILHCISPLFKISIKSNAYILDLGTGGGLPGIPWAILNENANFLLIDGTRKKIDAVSNIVKELGLKNVKTLWGRAEDIAKMDEYKNKFDYVICRAVADLKTLVKWSFNFLSKFHKKFLEKTFERYYLHSGCLIAFKGGDVMREIEDALKTKLVSGVEVMELNFTGFEKAGLEDKKVVLLKLTTKRD
jgi:16S rRNA (guanine527-N7)-methyltransferase